MRIVVLTDVHANLPALEAALAVIERDGYDLLVHTGDAIAIGPFPRECLERLLALPRALLLMGNHDAMFVDGLPERRPAWLDDGQVAHARWTYAQLSDAQRRAVACWPEVVAGTYGGVPITFLHYPLDGPRGWLSFLRDPDVAALDRAFAPYAGQLIFYGHHHPFADTAGRARYVNPGALGCNSVAEARWSVVEAVGGQASVTHHAAGYDDAPLFAAFEARAVPERGLLYRAFFGGRFGG